MKRYIKLFKRFVIYSLIRDMEYKGNFVATIIAEICWSVVSVISLEVMFYQTNTLVGWEKGEVFMLYAFYRIVSSFDYLLYARSIRNFSTLVNSGDFDIILTRPVSPLFFSTFRLVDLGRISQLVVGLIMVVYATNLIGFNWTLPAILSFNVLIVMAIIVRYCIEILMVTPVFWLQRLDNISDLSLTLSTAARFPRFAFPDLLRWFLTFVIPLLFVAAIPVELFLGKGSNRLWIMFGVMTLILAIVTRKFFAFALRHYSSASS